MQEFPGPTAIPQITDSDHNGSLSEYLHPLKSECQDLTPPKLPSREFNMSDYIYRDREFDDGRARPSLARDRGSYVRTSSEGGQSGRTSHRRPPQVSFDSRDDVREFVDRTSRDYQTHPRPSCSAVAEFSRLATGARSVAVYKALNTLLHDKYKAYRSEQAGSNDANNLKRMLQDATILLEHMRAAYDLHIQESTVDSLDKSQMSDPDGMEGLKDMMRKHAVQTKSKMRHEFDHSLEKWKSLDQALVSRKGGDYLILVDSIESDEGHQRRRIDDHKARSRSV